MLFSLNDTSAKYIMIELMRLNGEKFSLNVPLIEQIQSFPDTTITLVNGKKIIVKNKEKEVVQLINEFYQKIGIIGSRAGKGDVNE